MDNTGVVKVFDFGVAKYLGFDTENMFDAMETSDDEEEATQQAINQTCFSKTGAAGTYGYMAPEMILVK